MKAHRRRGKCIIVLIISQAGGGFAGCYTSPKKANSAGTNFNEGGGGVYAMEWTSVAIRIWFFPRGHIPPTVLSSHPDPSKFGVPDANFEGGCDIDKYFRNGTLIVSYIIASSQELS